MLIPWVLFLVSIAIAQEVNNSTEDTLNTTTLYPVTNKAIDVNKNYRNHTKDYKENIIFNAFKVNNRKDNINEKQKVEVTTPKTERITTWAIDASYAQPKSKQNQTVYAETQDNESREIHAEPKDKESQSIYTHSKDKENQAFYTLPKDKKSEDSKSTDSKEELSLERPNTDEKKFKPSPHLGSFFDDDNLKLLRFSTSKPFGLTGKKPAYFLGAKDFSILHYKSPMNSYTDHMIPPYRFETAHFPTTNNWKQPLESKPTVESSVKIPAGDLYKHSNPFKEEPSPVPDDDFGLDYNEDGREKENPVKNRSNPWKNLVQLVTAFLPVGLIISALTPNIITLQNTNNDPYPSRLSRRADGGGWGGAGGAAVPTISERCRRRLLCEIHSEENYLRSQDEGRFVRKHCYKLLCEEPQTLRRVLAWLLAHRPLPPRDPLPTPPPRYTNDHPRDWNVKAT